MQQKHQYFDLLTLEKLSTNKKSVDVERTKRRDGTGGVNHKSLVPSIPSSSEENPSTNCSESPFDFAAIATVHFQKAVETLPALVHARTIQKQETGGMMQGNRRCLYVGMGKIARHLSCPLHYQLAIPFLSHLLLSLSPSPSLPSSSERREGRKGEGDGAPQFAHAHNKSTKVELQRKESGVVATEFLVECSDSRTHAGVSFLRHFSLLPAEILRDNVFPLPFPAAIVDHRRAARNMGNIKTKNHFSKSEKDVVSQLFER